MTEQIELENSETSECYLPARLQNFIDLLSQIRKPTPQQVHRKLWEAQIQPEDLLLWATFDHPVTHSYGRKLVYNGGYFEVMVMSWVPGDTSAIHDHGAAQWGAVQCFGKASHWSYKLKNKVLQFSDHLELTPGQIVKVNHDLIHQMGNSSQDSFLSLHVYGVNDESSSITGNARVFDLFDQSIQYTDGGVFFCLSEKDINHKISGLSSDRVSSIRHHQQMRSRIATILAASPEKSAYWQSKADLLDREIATLK